MKGSALRIDKDDGTSVLHLCGGGMIFCDPSRFDICYSYRHAKDKGWIKTSKFKFCHPKFDYVWVCPSCFRRYLKQRSRKATERLIKQEQS